MGALFGGTLARQAREGPSLKTMTACAADAMELN